MCKESQTILRQEALTNGMITKPSEDPVLVRGKMWTPGRPGTSPELCPLRTEGSFSGCTAGASEESCSRGAHEHTELDQFHPQGEPQSFGKHYGKCKELR